METYIVAKSSFDWILISKELWDQGCDDFSYVVKEFQAQCWEEAEKVFETVSNSCVG